MAITDLDGSLQPRLLLGCEAGQREIVDHPRTLEAAEGAARGLQAGPDLCSDFFNVALHCILLYYSYEITREGFQHVLTLLLRPKKLEKIRNMCRFFDQPL